MDKWWCKVTMRPSPSLTSRSARPKSAAHAACSAGASLGQRGRLCHLHGHCLLHHKLSFLRDLLCTKKSVISLSLAANDRTELLFLRSKWQPRPGLGMPAAPGRSGVGRVIAEEALAEVVARAVGGLPVHLRPWLWTLLLVKPFRRHPVYFVYYR